MAATYFGYPWVSFGGDFLIFGLLLGQKAAQMSKAALWSALEKYGIA